MDTVKGMVAAQPGWRLLHMEERIEYPIPVWFLLVDEGGLARAVPGYSENCTTYYPLERDEAERFVALAPEEKASTYLD